MTRSVLALLVLLTLSATASAQQPKVTAIRQVQTSGWTAVESTTTRWTEVQTITEPVAEAAANVVVVLMPEGGGAFSKGSGVYLGERLIATAYHVVRGTSGNGTVRFRDGTVLQCKTIQTDKVWDQCILEIEQEHPVLQGVELAPKNPRKGEILYSCGFGAGFRIFSGRMTGDWAGPGGTQTTDWFDHENPAIPGDSGGPVFNEVGQLVGCLWGSDGRHTMGTGTGRFNVFVKPLFPRLAAWRAARIGRQIQSIQPQQSYCPPGVNCIPAPRYGGTITQPGYNPTPVPLPPQMPVPAPVPLGVNPSCVCDEQKIVAMVLEKMATDARFRGPEGPIGPQGLAGKDGADGKNGEVNASHLAAVTETIISTISSDTRFKGPKGDTGPAGSPASQIDVDALAQQILAKVKHPAQRVVLVDGKVGKILDDETYQPGEPIVLDFQQILRNARINN